MWAWLIVLPFIFILGYPYKLHLESLKLEQPVIVFAGGFWRATPLSFLFLGLSGMMLLLAFSLAHQPVANPITLLLVALVVALPGLALGFILLRLHISYWQHDRHASLTIHRDEQWAEYCNEDIYHRFALADVVQVIAYECPATGSRRAPWGHYSYQILCLRDGTQLLITCLLYSLLGPQKLLPAVRHTTITRYICWLPGNEASHRPL